MLNYQLVLQSHRFGDKEKKISITNIETVTMKNWIEIASNAWWMLTVLSIEQSSISEYNVVKP